SARKVISSNQKSDKNLLKNYKGNTKINKNISSINLKKGISKPGVIFTKKPKIKTELQIENFNNFNTDSSNYKNITSTTTSSSNVNFSHSMQFNNKKKSNYASKLSLLNTATNTKSKPSKNVFLNKNQKYYYSTNFSNNRYKNMTKTIQDSAKSKMDDDLLSSANSSGRVKWESKSPNILKKKIEKYSNKRPLTDLVFKMEENKTSENVNILGKEISLIKNENNKEEDKSNINNKCSPVKKINDFEQATKNEDNKTNISQTGRTESEPRPLYIQPKPIQVNSGNYLILQNSIINSKVNPNEINVSRSCNIYPGEISNSLGQIYKSKKTTNNKTNQTSLNKNKHSEIINSSQKKQNSKGIFKENSIIVKSENNHKLQNTKSFSGKVNPLHNNKETQSKSKKISSNMLFDNNINDYPKYNFEHIQGQNSTTSLMNALKNSEDKRNKNFPSLRDFKIKDLLSMMLFCNELIISNYSKKFTNKNQNILNKYSTMLSEFILKNFEPHSHLAYQFSNRINISAVTIQRQWRLYKVKQMLGKSKKLESEIKKNLVEEVCEKNPIEVRNIINSMANSLESFTKFKDGNNFMESVILANSKKITPMRKFKLYKNYLTSSIKNEQNQRRISISIFGSEYTSIKNKKMYENNRKTDK
ncbi:MAG: hypothetical protein MJ252_26465, partial [archaeon]|nr:hypothetical protein [archaeon]